LSDIDKAVEILAELGSDNFLPGDTFKLGLYQAASFILHTKALDTNRDGTISASEAIDLSDTSAAGLLNQIAAAQAMLEAQGVSDPAAAKAAESIKAYQDQIDAQPGANQEEKLRNFLSAKGGATSTLTSTATATSTGATLQLDDHEEEEREE
jgi:HJR/Mrr/RecB family endonuclease